MNTIKATDFLQKNLKNRKILAGIALALILVVAGAYWYQQSQIIFVPQEFRDSRNRAAEISSRIVQLTDASVTTLGQISAADQKGDYKRGLQLVQEEIDRNKEIKNQAFALSEELKIMLLNLGAVKPKKAAEVGLQATTSGLELAQRLVNYNNLAQELLSVLEMRLESNGSSETRQRIEQIILRMNEEAEAVNNLNNQYQEEMKEFDQLTGQ